MTQAPERIYGWLDSQMSIARYYGGLSYLGHSYVIDYDAEGQPLVRADVLTRERKERAAKTKAARQEAAQAAADKQKELL